MIWWLKEQYGNEENQYNWLIIVASTFIITDDLLCRPLFTRFKYLHIQVSDSFKTNLFCSCLFDIQILQISSSNENKPILKGGDETNCNIYRGISPLDVVYKILATVIKIKLEAMVEPLMGEYQTGFRKGRGTTDQLFIMKEIWTKRYE